jgi:hypothetical protein
LFLENLSFGRRVQKSIQQKKEHQEIRRIVGSKLAAYTIFICNAQLIDRVLPFALKTSPTIFTAGVFPFAVSTSIKKKCSKLLPELLKTFRNLGTKRSSNYFF